MGSELILRYAAFALFALALAIMAQTASAARCDCDYRSWQGSCKATVELRQDNWFVIESDTPQCSRVTWYIDGEPQTTIVTDGSDSTEWLGSGSSPSLAVESCKVCKDAKYEDRRNQESDAVDFSGTWRVIVDHPDGNRMTYKDIIERVGSNEYRIKTFGNDTGAGGVTGRLTVSGNSARITWHAEGWASDRLRIIGEDRMVGSDKRGAQIEYTRISD